MLRHPVSRYAVWGALLTGLLLLASCQPQAVEVTRVVSEETSVESAVEQEVQAQVTRVVTEAPAEPVEELEALPESEAGPDMVEALGSEEGGGSPIDPGSGWKTAGTRTASGGWVDITALPVSARVIEIASTEDAGEMIFFQRRTAGSLITVALTETGGEVTLERGALPIVAPLSVVEEARLWSAAESLPAAGELADLSVQLRCEDCEEIGEGELLILSRSEGVLTLAFDLGEAVDALEPLLSELRTTAIRQATIVRLLVPQGATCCRLRP